MSMKTVQILNVENIRKDFPILSTKVNNKPLAYLDNAATSLTPESVIKAMNSYYHTYNANVHRSIHTLGEKATQEYEDAHRKVAKFINASFEEIIFTRGTTESLNVLAYSLTKKLKKGEEIVLTEMEHHSNIVPWQEYAKEKGLIIKYIKVDKDGRLNLKNAEKLITDKTKIVSITHMSNVLGTINPVKEIGKLAHSHGAYFVVDGAQSVPHLKVDIKEMDCDFFAFSGHKMMGPTGIGVLYGKKKLLEAMDPFMYGGDMISEVSFKAATWNELPWKFEAGTPNIAGGIGLGAAVDYLNGIGMEKIREYEEYLAEYALKKVGEIENIEIYGPLEVKERGAAISFNIKGVHSHDVSTILDRYGVAIRGGHLCAMPLVKSVLGVNSVCRASLYIYNTLEEIDRLVEGIKKVKEIFKV